MSIGEKLFNALPKKVHNTPINIGKRQITAKEGLDFVKMANKLSSRAQWTTLQITLVIAVMVWQVSYMASIYIGVWATTRLLVIALETLVITIIYTKMAKSFWWNHYRKKTIALEDGIITRAEKKSINSLKGRMAGLFIISTGLFSIGIWALVRYLIIKAPYGGFLLCLRELYFVLAIGVISLITTYPQSKNFAKLTALNRNFQYSRNSTKRKVMEQRSSTKRGYNLISKKK